MTSLPVGLASLAIASALVASPAHACLEFHNAQSDAQAFAEADVVVRAEAVTESYLAVPGARSWRVGVATGRIIDVLKGDGLNKGDMIVYRVVDGDQDLFVQRNGPAPMCLARRFTRPGQTYRLHLKYAADRGPPTLIYPTDAHVSGGAR